MISQHLGSRKPKAAPRETDIHIGRRLREARLVCGLSQGALGKKLGVAFQQVQKYESGANRIGGSRLWDISRILQVPVSNFFEGLPSAGAPAPPEAAEAPLTRRSLQLGQAINAIENETVKLRVLRLLQAIAKAKSA